MGVRGGGWRGTSVTPAWGARLVVAASLLGVAGCGGPSGLPGSVLRACAEPGAWCENPRVDADADHVVFLVGDAGASPIEENSLLRDLRVAVRDVAETDVPVTVAFLGDNVYEVGVRAGNDEDLRKLDAQVQVVRDTPGSRGIFLPGNHDWAGHRDSVAVVCRQADVLAEVTRSETNTEVFMSPVAAVGPETFEIASRNGERLASLVTIDSQLWFTGSGASTCPDGRVVESDVAAATARLRALLDDRSDELVILAAHHPLVTGGAHGGGGDWLDRFLYLTRLSPQDLHAGPYAGYVDDMAEILADYDGPLLYAAGHDHSMQLQRMEREERPWYHLVSGSGSKQSGVGEAVREDLDPLFAAPMLGFARLDLRAGRSPRLTIFTACSEKDLAESPEDRPSLCRSAEDAAARAVLSFELR